MKINLENYIGSKPFLYGRKLLKDMGINGHYVNEDDVVDFLGYEIKTIHPEEYAQFGNTIGEIFDDTCAVLLRQQNLILLSNKLYSKRKRMTIYHECGHDIIPWHQANSFSLRGKDIDPTVHKTIEREAFLAGTEIMYPLKHFINDSLNLPLSLESIKNLADRYNGSFEATCIRYALTNQKIIAIVVVKKNTPIEEQVTFHNYHSNGQIIFPNMPAYKKLTRASTAPLRVQYCSRSYRFSKFIKSGTEIEKGNIIFDCWSQQKNQKGEIPASVFGSSTPLKYQAECIYDYERVFILLSLTDKQLGFQTEVN